MRLSWRREPRETGLAGVCQGPRGAILKVDGKDVGRVYSTSVGSRLEDGWFLAVRSENCIPLRNTCKAPVKTIDDGQDRLRGLRAEVPRRDDQERSG